MSDEIQLGELISKIKQELVDSTQELPTFLVEKVELEVQVTASKSQDVQMEGKGKSELKINVLPAGFLDVKLGELEGGGKINNRTGRENVHKVKLTLVPALLNKEFMSNLTPEAQEAIQISSMKVLVQGEDQERIR